MPDPSSISLEEYRVLRATIRQRGTMRPLLATLTFFGWGALAFAVQTWATTPVSPLVPLVVLAAGFEAVFAMHVGVERIGRYLQVYYEQPTSLPAWEHVAPRFGRQGKPPRPGIDPIFAGLFMAAAFVNVVPVVLLTFGLPPSWLGLPAELVTYGLLHLLFVGRVVQAWRYARGQRARDLEVLGPR